LTRAGLRQQDQKLVTTPAGNDVGAAEHATQQMGHFGQSDVTLCVAALVVDLFEVIEVQVQQAPRPASTHGPRVLLLEGLGEATDVEGTRQMVRPRDSLLSLEK
jgi:hypothetical protein